MRHKEIIIKIDRPMPESIKKAMAEKREVTKQRIDKAKKWLENEKQSSTKHSGSYS